MAISIRNQLLCCVRLLMSIPFSVGVSLIAAYSSVLHAQIYYVDFKAGSNSNSGTSVSSPWKHTPGDPNAMAGPKSVVLVPGDVIQFRSGVVYEGGFRPAVSGVPGNPVVYKGTGWGIGRAILEGNRSINVGIDVEADHIRIEGFEIRNFSSRGISLESYNYNTNVAKANSIHIIDNEIHDIAFWMEDQRGNAAYGKGIQVRYSSDVLIENNEIYRTNYDAITLSVKKNATIRGNHFHHGGVDGIKGGGGGTILIENNLIHDFSMPLVHSDALQMLGFSDTLIIRNNVFYDNGQTMFIEPYTADIGVGLDGDVIVEGNVIANTSDDPTGKTGNCSLGIGFDLYKSVRSITVKNNTISKLNCGNGGMGLSARVNPSGGPRGRAQKMVVKNNLLFNSGAGFDLESIDEFTADYNVYYNPARGETSIINRQRIYAGQELHSLSVEPEFVDANNVLGADERLKTMDDGLVPGAASAVCRAGESSADIGAYNCQGCVDNKPIPFFSMSHISGYEPLDVQFDATSSLTCSGSITSYEWNFGDGSTASSGKVLHQYKAGSFAVSLTVRDSAGQSGTLTKSIVVYPSAVPNLVLYLPLDGNLTDVSGRHHTAVWAKEPGMFVSGRIDRGVKIGTVPYVSVKTSSMLDGGAQLSFALWAKKSDLLKGGRENSTLLWKHGAYNLILNRTGFVADISGVGSVSTSEGGNDTSWHHYAATYDGKELSIYLDGKRVGSKALTGNVQAKESDLAVGSYPWGTPFDGWIDDVRVYDRGLPDQEVLALYADGSSSCLIPSRIVDLSNWKLTLPTGSAESPTEIEQPELASFSIDPFFKVADQCDAVLFRAPVNGVTTSGSGYPRSELREMTRDGKDRASWSPINGYHSMYLDQAITAHPKQKKHVVVGQIHDANDDVIVVRLEFPKLFVDINGKDGPVLDPNYVLGKRFQVQFVAEKSQIKIFYNNSSTPSYTLNSSASGCYFKAGIYTQSNCDTDSDCSSDNFGEARIYDVQVEHRLDNAMPVSPKIVVHPQNQSVLAGKSADFSVSATGSSPLIYRWFKNGAVISGATGSRYTTPLTSLNDNGSKFYCEVKNVTGVITSSTATLTVEQASTPNSPDDPTPPDNSQNPPHDNANESMGTRFYSFKNIMKEGDIMEIRYYVHESGPVTLELRNRQGEILYSVDEGERGAGDGVVFWNGRNNKGEKVASGIYQLELNVKGKKVQTKVVIVR